MYFDGRDQDGTTTVSEFLKCGFIDKMGNEVIPLKYDFFHGSVGDLTFVTFDGKDFYIDRSGVEYYESSQSTPHPLSACTYDPANDFSATMNPNGPWSFGYTPTLAGTLVLYDKTKIGEGILNYWYRGDHFNAPFPPELGHNPGGPRTQPGHVFQWAPNGFHLHPGPDGSFSVARWTAPSSGIFNVNSVFTMVDRGGTDVHVLHNSGSIFDDVIAGKGDSTSFSTVVSVNAGDTIAFSVGYNGNYISDSTSLAATISDSSCGTPAQANPY